MVYKLHPGDIIRAWLRQQGAVITAANTCIAVFLSFLRLSNCTDTCLSHGCAANKQNYSIRVGIYGLFKENRHTQYRESANTG